MWCLLFALSGVGIHRYSSKRHNRILFIFLNIYLFTYNLKCLGVVNAGCACQPYRVAPRLLFRFVYVIQQITKDYLHWGSYGSSNNL